MDELAMALRVGVGGAGLAAVPMLMVWTCTYHKTAQVFAAFLLSEAVLASVFAAEWLLLARIA